MVIFYGKTIFTSFDDLAGLMRKHSPITTGFS